MTQDLGSLIYPIGYNIRNLPATVGIIEPETNYYYYYDANDLRARVLTPTGGRYYINGADGKTEAVVDANNPGIVTHNIFGNDLVGQVKRNVSTLNRYYYLKDHLGSIRVTVDPSNTVVGYDDYDPWGMILDTRSLVSAADARYRFTEKERDSETGHFWFGARAYEPRIGRWLTVDPLAEKYLAWNPYNYTLNNPVANYDPDGKGVNPANGPKDWRERLSNPGGYALSLITENIRESAKAFLSWDILGGMGHYGAAVLSTITFPLNALDPLGTTAYGPGIITVGAGRMVAQMLREGQVISRGEKFFANSEAINALGKELNFSKLEAVVKSKKPATWGGELTGGAHRGGARSY